MQRLNIDDIDYIKLSEAKTKFLTACENKYGKDFVYSPKLSFEFTSSNVKDVYALLNAYLFDNRLNFKNIALYRCTLEDLKALSKQHNIIGNSDELYAAYVPELNKKTKKIVSESIFFIDDYAKKTFLFGVACLCHEMIHQYDANYGILTQMLEEDEKLRIDKSHQTPMFQRFMKLAALEGIRVMINGNNTPYDILNQEAVQFTLNLQEDADKHFDELVKRLEAGEKIPNVFLTNRDTVAFFIP